VLLVFHRDVTFRGHDDVKGNECCWLQYISQSVELDWKSLWRKGVGCSGRDYSPSVISTSHLHGILIFTNEASEIESSWQDPIWRKGHFGLSCFKSAWFLVNLFTEANNQCTQIYFKCSFQCLTKGVLFKSIPCSLPEAGALTENCNVNRFH